MKNVNRVIGLVLIIFGIWIIYRTYSFPNLNVTETGPGFFPRITAIGIIILSLILIIKSFIIPDENKVKFLDYKKVLIVIGIMIFYVTGFLILGFITSSIISLTAIMYLMGLRKKILILSASLISTITIYFVFTQVFNVPLPEGILL